MHARYSWTPVMSVLIPDSSLSTLGQGSVPAVTVNSLSYSLAFDFHFPGGHLAFVQFQVANCAGLPTPGPPLLGFPS